MLTVKKVFCITLLHYVLCGNVVQNQILSHKHNFTKAPTKLPVSTPPSPPPPPPPPPPPTPPTPPSPPTPPTPPPPPPPPPPTPPPPPPPPTPPTPPGPPGPPTPPTLPTPPCPPEKSLHSRHDIKVMIDHVYNESSLDKKIKEDYRSKAEEIRDKRTQELTHFMAWFDKQPVHLKHILRKLDTLRKEQVEPTVKIASEVVSEYPKLEMSYKEKNNKTKELLKKLDRYKKICKLNCEDEQVKMIEPNRTKRNIQNDFYCSSLQDLYKEITEKLDESVKKLNNSILEHLALEDKNYKEKIDEIESQLKEKALNMFGRTMYDILSLEDEFEHFIKDIASLDLNETVYEIKSLELQVDVELLQLEQAIEKFRQRCKSCGSKTLGRYVRRADLQSEVKAEKVSPVSELIEEKINEIKAEVETDCNKIFNDLDILIQTTELDEESLEKLKLIQDEINRMTNDEKEALSKLKNLGLKLSFKTILELLKTLKELLKLIQDVIHSLI